MRMLGREGYLLFFDEIHPQFTLGAHLQSETETLKIVYIDRENGELGCLPASQKMRRKIQKRLRDSYGAGDA
jgi:hypothetical protein